jgi:carbon monoxide dehydrogenase subunit G
MVSKNLLERLLSPVEVRATVPAAPEAVFAVLSNPDTYPEWLAGAQHIQPINGDSRTGSAPPHRLELEVHAGPVKGTVEFDLERTGSGTLVTFRERMTGALGAAMPALRGPIFLRNRASLDKLRQRFEPLVVRL